MGRQLTVSLTLGVICVALGVAFSTTWFFSQRMYGDSLRRGLHITEGLAQQSALALLVNSTEDAEAKLHSTLGFPDIIYAAIYSAEHNRYTLLSEQGRPDPWRPAAPDNWLNSPTATAHETPQSWHFLAPVYPGYIKARSRRPARRIYIARQSAPDRRSSNPPPAARRGVSLPIRSAPPLPQMSREAPAEEHHPWYSASTLLPQPSYSSLVVSFLASAMPRP